jgi:diaminopimelate epimerase
MSAHHTLRLGKYHGLGNDFLVMTHPLPDGLDPAEVARRACHRHTGVGADGLVLASAPGPDGAELAMVLHNADGTRAEMSGNGIRCLVHAALDTEMINGGGTRSEQVSAGSGTRAVHLEVGGRVEVATDAGRRTVSLGVRAVNGAGGELRSSVTMGEVAAGDPAGVGDLIVRAGAHDGMAVDVGNPHVVLRFADRAAIDAAATLIGGNLPEANIELVAPGPDRGRIVMRVIERGVGETMACGTGACAAAWAARKWGLALSDDAVMVHMPGGAATVSFAGDRATLSGPSVRIGWIDWEVVC